MIPSSMLMSLGLGFGADAGAPLAAGDIASPLPRRWVEAAGLRIATAEAGEGAPVVLLHGMSSYAAFWGPVIPALLQRGYRVLVPDLPGFGASDKPDAPYSPPWYAKVVLAWMDALGLEAVPVLGHSMGGQIALTMALDAPKRVQRLILSAPAGVETFSAEAAQFMRSYWHERRAAEALPVEVVANFVQLAYFRDTPEVRRLLTERLRLQKHPDFLPVSRAVSRSIAGMLDHPVASRLNSVRQPTTALWGAEDRMIPNPVFTRGSAADMVPLTRRLMPQARVELLPGAGHFVHADAPEAFNTRLLRALQG